MPRLTARFTLLALIGCCPGCNKDYPNPFAQDNRSVPPPASAGIVLSSGAWSTQANAPRELFAIDPTGANLTRLTFCNDTNTCDWVEPVPSPDRNRMMARLVTPGTEGTALTFIDLIRGATANIAVAAGRVSGADWSPQDGVVVYSAVGQGALEDLYRVDPNGQNVSNLTQTDTVRERRPRIDPGGNVAVYERIEGSGKGSITIFQTSTSQSVVTTGGPGEGVLSDTNEPVGSDTDPDFSPDAKFIVFRRLTSTANGIGTWDIMTVKLDGSSLTPIASGPLYRGTPDWSSKGGIIFTEADVAAGTVKLVLVQPDGSGRQVLLTQALSTEHIPQARWLY
jgi:Tol biopolymer transport system component